MTQDEREAHKAACEDIRADNPDIPIMELREQAYKRLLAYISAKRASQ